MRFIILNPLLIIQILRIESWCRRVRNKLVLSASSVLLISTKEGFIQFFARTQTGHYNINIVTLIGFTHLMCNIVDIYRFTHIKHHNFTRMTNSPCKHHQQASIRNEHKVPGSVLISKCNGTAVENLLRKQRFDRAARAKNVTESNRYISLPCLLSKPRG